MIAWWALSVMLCTLLILLSTRASNGKAQSFQLQVTGTGRTIMVDASPTMTAARLSRVIKKQIGAPRGSFALYHASKPMCGTLEESGVASGSTVELKFRGRGGGPEPEATNSLEVEIERRPAQVSRGPTAMMRGCN